jgi:uncharacterized DUF497 family protein
VEIEFDSAKDVENLRKHGVSLARAEEFDLGSGPVECDRRRDYGEDRFNAVGLLDGVLYSLVFTMRMHRLRAISLRIANRKERKSYARYCDEDETSA